MIRSIKRWFTIILIVAGCTLLLYCASSPRVRSWFRYIQIKSGDVELPVATSLEQCMAAPFVMPTTGWIGIVYGDSILGTQNHSGLDIFGLEGNGITPVYAAYDGYLTRLPEWTSAVQRVDLPSPGEAGNRIARPLRSTTAECRRSR